jgi:creatinine amidohydrolase
MLREGEVVRTNIRVFLMIVSSLSLDVLALAQNPNRAESVRRDKSSAGILLEQISWEQAERVLTPERVIVIPLGAEAKEHGLHLPLGNDWTMADYLKNRVLEAAPVVIAPTINYSYYPAFLEYPGSTSLKLETARDMIVDICRSLASYGPPKFYVLNTGISTVTPLDAAAKILAADGLVLRYTDLKSLDAVTEKIQEQPGGTHADEIETSMMLYIAPNTVNMKRAVKDFNPRRPGGLTRNSTATRGIYSPTGAWDESRNVAIHHRGWNSRQSNLQILQSFIHRRHS